ncbi:AsmA family protein [Vibrio maerlii]|uniref:AsmA family protein n=1 Tax=Vibrio maerlii TaxID=2231648 RepID=UPI000E3D6ECE|nr:AsmA family protein [Vibrio maerlii]
MKKTISILFIVICLTAVCLASLLLVLQTKHATWIVNRTLDYLELPITVKQAQYTYPNHFELTDISLNYQEGTSLPIAKAELWLSESLLHNQQINIDSILVQGLSLQEGKEQTIALKEWGNQLRSQQHFKLHQLAIAQLDYSDGVYVGRDISVQIKQPHWETEEQIIPYGEIQLSAAQAYWQQQAFDNLLINLDYKPKDSTIYGLSFKWLGAQVSGQAEQYPQGWSLVNFTIEQLNTSIDDLQTQSADMLSLIQAQVTHINSLDIINSQLTHQDLTLENLNLSAENLDLTSDLWQQKGYLSLAADNLQWQEYQLIEPSFKLTFEKDKLLIDDFNGELYQGDVYLSGELTPNSLHLTQLSISGVKATLNSELEALFTYPQYLEQLSIDQLSVENSQLIQINTKPYWQGTGVNLDAKQLELKRNGRWGVWQGDIRATANSLSLDNIIGTQAIVEMSSDDGLWQLNRAFIPLESGYIEGVGEMQFERLSKPWKLEISADGVPIDILNHYIEQPVELAGFAEMDINLNGLAGDNLMLAHSLSGQLWSELRDTELVHDEQSHRLAFETLDWQFIRGIGSHQPINVYLNEPSDAAIGSIDGQIDLLDEDKRIITLSVEVEGEVILVEKKF